MRSEVKRSARRRAPVLARRLAACAGAAGGLPSRAAARSVARSFTLIEVLVAVGAVALVAVAIAAVFDQTGRTVTAGRRLSAMTSYAALIEQQMRADFARMTRDGYLIIRNDLADVDRVDGFTPGVDVVPLHADDLNARARRIDEIMFFAKGDFTTSRDPLDPSQVARGNAARIYYGHGKRQVVDLTAGFGNPYLWPDPLDPNNDPDANLGVLPTGGVVNPNRYASDWTLLRLQTVLVPPRTTQVDWVGIGGLPLATLIDKDTQIAYQPAASGIFRALNTIFPALAEPTIRANIPPGQGPQFTGGTIDVASTSLTEIRSVVVTGDTWPGGVPGGATGTAADNRFFDPIVPGQANGGADGTNQGVDGQSRVWAQATTAPGGDDDVLMRTQSWMEDGLPAWSHATNPDDRVRVRYEPAAPNYLEVLRTPATTPMARLQQAWERTDQVMLSSSNFLPRCTEFIVEWSFGNVYNCDPANTQYIAGRPGETIWHGMARRADGTPTTQLDTQVIVKPYTWDSNGGGDPRCRVRKRYRQVDGQLVNGPFVYASLIHGQSVLMPYDPPVGEPVTSYFGYVDPTFDPDKDFAPPATAAPDGKLISPLDSATATIPWVWPKLVRVTIGLADPNDPSIEQRFQFVFELPPTPEP